MSDLEEIDYDYAAQPSIKLECGKKYRIKIHLGTQVHYVEVPDILFNHNSAVPCLDENGWLLGALITTLKFAQAHSELALVLIGHADTSGQISYNYDISGLRASAVKAILSNNEPLWKETVLSKNGVKDYQMIFKTLSSSFGWDCDPGAVDGVDGPKTKSAVKGFKAEAKSRYGLNVTNIDTVDNDTWGTIFQVYSKLIIEALQSTTLPDLQFTYDTGKGVYACGESFPIDNAQKSNYKSQENRRVEIAFGQPGFFDCMPQPDKNKLLTRDQCPVLNHESYLWTLIPNEMLSSNLLCKASIQDPIEGGIASLQVTIHFEDGSTVSKTTDSKGCLEFECAKEQKFVKFEYKQGNKTYILEYFPRPAPVDTDDGIWQRLVNLGYWGEGDAPRSPSEEQLQAALQAFQMDFEIDATGKTDAETQDKLVELSSNDKYWKDESFSTVENQNDDKPKEKVA